MKIAFLVLLYPPKWLAGTELATLHLAKNLALRGHEVHVLTTADRDLPKEELSDAIHVHRIRCIRRRFIWTLHFGIAAQTLLKNIRPDIVQAQGAGMGFVGLIGKCLYHIPFTVWCQGSDVYIQNPLKRRITRRIFRHANRVVALTEDMRRECRKIHETDVSIVPVGITAIPVSPQSRDTIRRQLRIGPDKKIILFGGNLRPVKRVEDLVRAMSHVSRIYPDAHLVVAGDGEERGRLEALAGDLELSGYVRFLGRWPSETMQDIMTASDIFVLPSESEGFPLTILEAMASGLPVVATDIRGMKEIVLEGVNGCLVPPKNPEALAEKIVFLLNHDALRQKQSEANREKAKLYTWEHIAELFEREYLHHINR